MAFGETFDLARIIGSAEQIKAMRRDAEDDAIRRQYLQAQIANTQQAGKIAGAEEERAATQFSQEQQLYNTQLLHAAATAVETDPAALPRYLPQLKKAGVLAADFDTSKIAPEQIKQLAGQLRQQTGTELQAYLASNPQMAQLAQKHQYELEQMSAQHQNRLGEISASGAEQRRTAQASAARPDAVSQQLVTRPVGNGFVQDFAWNPKTNTRVPSGEPYKPVTPHTGNVTEGERKAAALGTRLESAMQTLNALETTAPGASRPGLIERGLEAVGLEAGANVARSSERQQADAAQLDALDAALTLATGAAYTREQLQNLRKSYFPQIGDSPENVAAKQKRFETIVETARIASGRAEPAIDRALSNDGAPAGGSTIVKSDADYARLPSGAEYIAPDGSRRRKK